MIWVAGFWSSVALVGYVLAGFPLLVALRAWRAPDPTADRLDEHGWPAISVIIAARNEVSCIAPKIERLLATDYPEDRLEVVVASDGSDDGTDDAVRAFAARGVRLLSLPRAGKAAALNAAVEHATGDVLVFTDANSWFADGALKALVQPLADPLIGGVAGDQRYVAGSCADPATDGERAYWSLDRALKRAESRGGSTISATGAIYAVRRELVDVVPDDVTDDFYISTGVVAAGRRLVFAPGAVAYEAVAGSADLEFARKVRIMTRGLTAVRRRATLLDPRRSGFYAIQLLSHKVLRRLVAVPVLASMACALPLVRRHAIYRLVLVGEAAFVAAGVAGLTLGEQPVAKRRALALPAYACLVHAAALRAGWNLARDRTITKWEPPSR